MALYLSRNLVLEFDPWADGPNGNFPVIGWQNLLTRENVTASYAAAGFPATNLANPNTAARWLSTHSVTTQYLTIAFEGSHLVDYVGIARHNLGSSGATVSVQAQSEPEGSWVTVFEERVLPSDRPAILRFEPNEAVAVRLRIMPDGVPPTIAVLHIGKLLVMERGLQEGHVPAHLAAQDEVVTGTAESGDYLGRIVTRQSLSTGVSFRFLRKAWYDQAMVPFARIARGTPFFFAWMPEDYPDEAAFCWTTSDLRPEAVMMAEGVFMHLSFEMGALVL